MGSEKRHNLSTRGHDKFRDGGLVLFDIRILMCYDSNCFLLYNSMNKGEGGNYKKKWDYMSSEGVIRSIVCYMVSLMHGNQGRSTNEYSQFVASKMCVHMEKGGA